MVKDDWPPGMTDQTRISPKILSLDLVCTWSKMIDPPGYDRPDQDLT